MTVAFGILCFGFMPNTPAESRFLTEEERDHALRRMRLDASGSSSIDVDDEKFNWHWVKMALLAPQTYLFSLLWFCLLVSLHSFSLFLPSIISVMGYEAMIAQLLTAPPNIAGFISVIASSYLSDRTKIRGPFIAGGSLLGIVGYTMLLVSDRNPVRYAGTFFIAIGVYQCSALMMVRSIALLAHYILPSCRSRLLTKTARAPGLDVQQSRAALRAGHGRGLHHHAGHVLCFYRHLCLPRPGHVSWPGSSPVFLLELERIIADGVRTRRPHYRLGHSVSLGGLVLTFILAIVTMGYLRWENKKRGNGDRNGRLLQPDADRLGHRHPKFRYTL